MKFLTRSLIAAVAVLGINGAFAGDDPVSTVQKGCAAEIESFCSQVTPGDGRLLACFFAHEDKLSGQCQYALYTASAQLEQAVNALAYVAGECEDDILAHCGDVYVGEGRVLDCLKGKGDDVSQACRTAMGEVFTE